MLVPDLLGRLTILNAANEVALHLGEWPEVKEVEGWPNLKSEQRLPQKFIAPHDAIWDRAGNIYVVEWIYGGRVTKLRRVT